MAIDNWDTEEVAAWIANDEPLYNAVRDLVRLNQLTEFILKELYVSAVDAPGYIKVDLDRVDWQKLIEELNEEFSEIGESIAD